MPHAPGNLRRCAGSQKSGTDAQQQGQVVLLGILLIQLGAQFCDIRILTLDKSRAYLPFEIKHFCRILQMTFPDPVGHVDLRAAGFT